MKVLLSTAYWPNLHYFCYVLNSDSIYIEQFENYQKQSFRNRTQILTANGALDLSIPVKKNAPKEFTKDITISYQEKWQIKHWRAITSAYKNSPYFEHFESEIEPFYTQEFENLSEYNFLQLETVLRILKLKKDLQYSSAYIKTPENLLDLRGAIHPKKEFKTDSLVIERLNTSYYQTFENKFTFVPNLSILDLIFNTGLETIDYLQS
ncbi:hypothetical protein CNR22_02775 [Sphingobacteriaceae bacterium]|nr:hypothetical protein CNR22_02775 [Sphingobacteriaceae bacterium]